MRPVQTLIRGSLLLVLTTLAGCQTTNLQSRALVSKPDAKRCERFDDRRKDCADQVGCYWDYDQSKCSAD